MTYYNSVAIVFSKEDEFSGKLDYRMGCQILPRNSIPIAIVSSNKRTIVRVTNGRETNEIISLLKDVEEFKCISTFTIVDM